MRIVAHNGARIWGGAERATVSLLRGLGDRGHEVVLLCNSPLVASEASKRGISSRICPIGGDASLHHAWRIKRELDREKPDAFIVGTYKKLFIASWGARKANVPRVIARVGLESDTPRSFKYRWALRRWTDGVVVNATRIAAPFREIYSDQPSRVRVIWNSVAAPDQLQQNRKVRDELGISQSAFVIGAVARLSIQKRLDRMLRCIAKIGNAHCIIAGEGTRRADLEELIEQLGIRHRVHLLRERTDVSDVLDALDVYVVTSNSEGMSNAMLEAMSRAIPVVSTDVSGAHDALAVDEAGNSAGVITSFDESEIETAIVSLKNDQNLRKQLGAEGRRRSMTHFSREKMLSDWEEFLRPQ